MMTTIRRTGTGMPWIGTVAPPMVSIDRIEAALLAGCVLDHLADLPAPAYDE